MEYRDNYIVEKCPDCKQTIEPKDIKFCGYCGFPIEKSSIGETNETKTSISNKSKKTALILCITLGFLGMHRFYVGKSWTALIMIFITLMVRSEIMIESIFWLMVIVFWIIYDVLFIIFNEYKDKQGRYLVKWV